MTKKKIRKITEANITFVSLVKRGANLKNFAILKNVNGDGTQFQTPIIKTLDEQRIAISIVYEPDILDSDGEFMDSAAIEKSAHNFMAKYRNIDIEHNFQKADDVYIVESYIAPCDYQLGDQLIRKGSWVMATKFDNKDLWNKVKDGTFNGYSMGGTANYEDVEEEPKSPKVTKKSLKRKINAKEFKMNKLEIEKMLNKSMEDQVDEEQVVQEEFSTMLNETAESIMDVVAEALKPLMDRVERLERSLSDFVDDSEEVQKKLSNKVNLLETSGSASSTDMSKVAQKLNNRISSMEEESNNFSKSVANVMKQYNERFTAIEKANSANTADTVDLIKKVVNRISEIEKSFNTDKNAAEVVKSFANRINIIENSVIPSRQIVQSQQVRGESIFKGLNF